MQWQSRIRLYALVFLLLGGFGALAYQLREIQINRPDEFLSQVPGTDRKTVRVPGVRGEIKDRNGITLAGNRFSFEVTLHLKDLVDAYRRMPRAPGESVPEWEGAAGTSEYDAGEIVRKTVVEPLRAMGIEIPFSAADVQRHYRSTLGVVPYALTSELSFAEYCVLAERTLDISGVHVEARPVRTYPFRALACHLLGYISAPDEERDLAELEKRAAGNGPDAERARQELDRYDFFVPDPGGANGVEKSEDGYLRGKAGMRTLLRNERGVIVREVGFEPPQPGADVYLSIDARLQYVAEMAIRQIGIGAAVVLDPRTGEILAMASLPTFDPNLFVPAITQEDWDRYLENPAKPFVNRAIRAFAPGSVFKIAVAAAGCEKGLGSRSYNCPGAIRYGNRLQKCWIYGKGAHGYLNLAGAIQKSCNCYFYQFGNAAGIESIVAMAGRFGLGSKTGIPVSGESSGLVPGPAYLEKASPGQRWTPARTALVSIGQAETEATPLQMASVAATLANGGTFYQPQLITRIAERDGTPVRSVAPQPRHRLLESGVSEADLGRIRKGMKDVVQSAGGTAGRARIEGVELAGKTGTAEFLWKGVMQKHAWFIGFAPFDEPKYAVAVFVFLGKGGGRVAAPIAREILRSALELETNPLIQAAPLEEMPGEFRFLEDAPSFDGEFLIPGAPGGEGESADPDEGPVLDQEDLELQRRDAEPETVPESIRVRVRPDPDVREGGGSADTAR